MNSSDIEKIGKYEISNMCLKTYPCKHYIRNCEDNSNFVTMSGPKIYHLLKKDGLSDKHFDEYANYVIVE